jgi:hypothetical protein
LPVLASALACFVVTTAGSAAWGKVHANDGEPCNSTCTTPPARMVTVVPESASVMTPPGGGGGHALLVVPG